MKETRIVEKFWRDDRTGKVKSYFIVQTLRKWTALFGKEEEEWKTCYRTAGILSGHTFKMELDFKSLKEAKEYRKNLLKEIPEDKIYRD